MTEQRQKTLPSRNSTKTLLTTLKLTTTVGAVSLTLAGWGLLSAAEAINAAATQPPATSFVSAAPARSAPVRTSVTATTAQRAPTQNPAQSTGKLRAIGSTSSSAPATLPAATPTATPKATATPEPTATPKILFKLDVVQWLQTQAGDPVAVVRDNNGTLWYVWGTDVPLIEQGLAPTVQPQPVNGRGRSRGS